MNIGLHIDTRQLDQFADLAPKRLAYAVAGAINNTAKRIQGDVRASVRRNFTLRGRAGEFVTRQAAVIKPFASVREGRPYAEISVGERKRLLLPGYETGAMRMPVKGKNVAVPVVGGPARPTWASSVPEPFTFRGMRLKKVIPRSGTLKRRIVRGRKVNITFAPHITSTGRVQFKGEHRTFLLPHTRTGLGMVLQRFGPKRGETLLVYAFDHPPELPEKLGFVATARSAQQFFYEEMDRQLQDVLAHDAAKLLTRMAP